MENYCLFFLERWPAIIKVLLSGVFLHLISLNVAKGVLPRPNPMISPRDTKLKDMCNFLFIHITPSSHVTELQQNCHYY